MLNLCRLDLLHSEILQLAPVRVVVDSEVLDGSWQSSILLVLQWCRYVGQGVASGWQRAREKLGGHCSVFIIAENSKR